MKQGLSKTQMDEIAELASLRDEEIEDWNGAVVGKFYRPVKQSITMRLDTDVVDWLKKDDSGYQTRANKLLVL
jgi:uncharacterized protein (DUF4415 family)